MKSIRDVLYECSSADVVVKHQQNYLRIQELRRTSDSLDETIKNTIRLLADARRDIASIPSIDTSADRREVDVNELLSYAKYIAPTTVPPTYRKPVKDDSQSQSKATEPQDTTQIANGLSTPPQTTADDVNPAFIKSENIGLQSMEERDKAWLLPDPDVFQPWPTQDVMNSGALGDIQRMLERGEDPKLKLSKQVSSRRPLSHRAWHRYGDKLRHRSSETHSRFSEILANLLCFCRSRLRKI